LTRIIVPEIKDWLNQELGNLNTADNYNGVEDHLRYRKIKGSSSLGRQSLAILRELTSWREQEARAIDRPRGHVVIDKILVAIARDQVISIEELSKLELLSRKKLKRYGKTIIDTVKIGLSANDDDLPESNRPVRLNAIEKLSYQQLTNYIDLKCSMLGVDPHLVGNNTEFKQLIKTLGNSKRVLPHKFSEGWRKKILEEFFRQHH